MVMTKSATKIAVLYSLFAGLSRVVHIGSQMLSMLIYSGVYAVKISIFIGTFAGLPLRYFLEKSYIFSFQSKNIKHEGQLFILYGFMGIFTTVIFWGTEYAFHLIFTIDVMRYIGGVLGLTIGYYVKYQLDKRFVFIDRSEKAVAI
jgi:putative flippase GtrA